MKTYRKFVEDINENIAAGQVMRAALSNAIMGGLPKRVVDTLKASSGIPVKAPVIRAPLPTPKVSVPKVTRVNNLMSNPIAATITALTDLQGSTPQSGPAAERAKAERESQIQSRWGREMNLNPSKFGKSGPDFVPVKTAPIEKTKVVEPVAAKLKPAPVVAKPKPAPVVARPKPTGPITSAQAIAMGSKEGQPSKSSVSTYRDAADKKGTSVGRYLTLAQHRQAVADRKATEAKKGK